LLAEPENPESFADETAKLLDDPDLRRQLGTNGRGAVHGKYTAEAMTEENLTLYRHLLGRDSPTPAPAPATGA
ncbi:MAG: hypothetical protein MI919_03165, partial [Holophagales bacterium]|nr:hypothetical protein [Holophagales bacterium]